MEKTPLLTKIGRLFIVAGLIGMIYCQVRMALLYRELTIRLEQENHKRRMPLPAPPKEESR